MPDSGDSRAKKSPDWEWHIGTNLIVISYNVLALRPDFWPADSDTHECKSPIGECEMWIVPMPIVRYRLIPVDHQESKGNTMQVAWHNVDGYN